jgi:hypothetical protein
VSSVATCSLDLPAQIQMYWIRTGMLVMLVKLKTVIKNCWQWFFIYTLEVTKPCENMGVLNSYSLSCVNF